MAPLAAAAADQLFVRESWPWTLLREAAFHSRGLNKGDFGRERITLELKRALKRDDTGPIAIWTLIQMGYGPQPVAKVGHRRLHDGTFEREVAMLTTQDTGMLKVLKFVVPLVKSYPEEDTAWTCSLAGEQLTAALRTMANMLRRLDATSDEALRSSLRDLLTGEFRDLVAQDLRRTSAEPQVADEPTARQRR